MQSGSGPGPEAEVTCSPAPGRGGWRRRAARGLAGARPGRRLGLRSLSVAFLAAPLRSALLCSADKEGDGIEGRTRGTAVLRNFFRPDLVPGGTRALPRRFRSALPRPRRPRMRGADLPPRSSQESPEGLLSVHTKNKERNE